MLKRDKPVQVLVAKLPDKDFRVILVVSLVKVLATLAGLRGQSQIRRLLRGAFLHTPADSPKGEAASRHTASSTTGGQPPANRRHDLEAARRHMPAARHPRERHSLIAAPCSATP